MKICPTCGNTVRVLLKVAENELCVQCVQVLGKHIQNTEVLMRFSRLEGKTNHLAKSIEDLTEAVQRLSHQLEREDIIDVDFSVKRETPS